MIIIFTLNNIIFGESQCVSKSKFENAYTCIKSLFDDSDFIHRHRLSKQAFTRNRKLSFSTLITFLINHRKGASQTELDLFFADHLGDFQPKRHVTKSAVNQARQHLSYQAFVELNHQFVNTLYDGDLRALKRWRGFRVCAVDGSQIRLPVSAPLQSHFGCQSGIAGTATQTMGLASVYYDVLNKMVIDASLSPTTASEKQAALEHLNRSKGEDLVLYDRGYNAFWMYACHQSMQRYFCMRCRVKRDNRVRDFIDSGLPEAIVTYTPNRISQKQCQDMGLPDTAIKLRLIRVDLPSETEVLITNLMDKKRYPATQFKRLYHLRWGVEEFYKRLKYHQEVENMSGKSVRVVMQDFHAKILSGNLTAALAIAGNHRINQENNGRSGCAKTVYQINFSQAFAKMKQYQARLWTLCGAVLKEYLKDLVILFSQFKEQVRPDRSFPRKLSKFNKRRYWMHYKCTL